VHQPWGPDHQQGRAGAEHAGEHGGEPVRQQPGGDALAEPDQVRRPGAVGLAAPPPGQHAGRGRAAEQQDPGQRYQRVGR
jgi:hypothetical protein